MQNINSFTISYSSKIIAKVKADDRQTDKQTDRRTGQKQYAPDHSMRGIKRECEHLI